MIHINQLDKKYFAIIQKDDLIINWAGSRTASFELAHIVAREPARPAVQHTLPPAAILLAGHPDDVALVEGELVFVGLLEVEARLHQHLLPAVLRHVLEQDNRMTEWNGPHMRAVGRGWEARPRICTGG